RARAAPFPPSPLPAGAGAGGGGAIPRKKNQKPTKPGGGFPLPPPPRNRFFLGASSPPIYFLAQRMPATRYLHAGPLFGNFDPHHLQPGFDPSAHLSPRDVSRTLEDLKTYRPAVIVDTAPADIHDWSKIPLHKFPSLARYVEEKYRLVARSGGAAVYQRR